MLQYRLYSRASLLPAFVKASANISSDIDQFGFSEYLLLELYLSLLIIHALRLWCGCFRTGGSFYVWFCFNSLRLTYTPQMADNWCLSSWLSITTPANSISPGAFAHLSRHIPSFAGNLCWWWLFDVLHHHLWSGEPSQAGHHLSLYFCKSRLRFYCQFLGNDHCTGLLQNGMEVVKRRKLMEVNMTS